MIQKQKWHTGPGNPHKPGDKPGALVDKKVYHDSNPSLPAFE